MDKVRLMGSNFKNGPASNAIFAVIFCSYRKQTALGLEFCLLHTRLAQSAQKKSSNKLMQLQKCFFLMICKQHVFKMTPVSLQRAMHHFILPQENKQTKPRAIPNFCAALTRPALEKVFVLPLSLTHF